MIGTPFSIAELKPFDGRDCSLDGFDPAYYENLGPLASYISTYKGNQNTRQAILDEELDDRCDAKEDSKCVTDCGEEPEDETGSSTFVDVSQGVTEVASKLGGVSATPGRPQRS